MMKLQQKSPTQALIEERDRLTEELRMLQSKIEGLEYAINLIASQMRVMSPDLDQPQPPPRGTTAIIRQLLEEAGSTGLTPKMAVERAALRGEVLNKTSVSSLLSRMKREGEILYTGRRYILKPAA